MQNLEQLKEYAKEQMDKFPVLKDEIWSFVILAQDEIEDGGSVWNEVNLAYDSINDLIPSNMDEEEM